jgi:hypothetical protein
MSEENSNRQRNGRWLKGAASPNPSGRPAALAEVIELAREHSEAAIETLRAIATDAAQPAQARVSAAVAILNRGYGAPPNALDVSIIKPDDDDNDGDSPLDDLTLAELEILQTIVQARQARTLLAAGDAPEPVAMPEAKGDQTSPANGLGGPSGQGDFGTDSGMKSVAY